MSSLMLDGTSFRHIPGREGSAGFIPRRSQHWPSFLSHDTDAEEVKDKEMAAGVQFLKNSQSSEEELIGTEKNRAEVFSWLLPTCVDRHKVNRHNTKPHVCLQM